MQWRFEPDLGPQARVRTHNPDLWNLGFNHSTNRFAFFSPGQVQAVTGLASRVPFSAVVGSNPGSPCLGGLVAEKVATGIRTRDRRHRRLLSYHSTVATMLVFAVRLPPIPPYKMGQS